MAFHELGVLLFSLRRLGEAQAVLERGVEIAPAMPELSVVLGGVFLDRLDRSSAKLAASAHAVSSHRRPRRTPLRATASVPGGLGDGSSTADLKGGTGD